MRHTLSIVGAKFRPPALGLLGVLPSGAELIVRREPTNAYDANALMVLVARSTLESISPLKLDEAVAGFGSSRGELMEHTSWHLGYVPREDALLLAPRLDRAEVSEVEGSLSFGPSGHPRVTFEEP